MDFKPFYHGSSSFFPPDALVLPFFKDGSLLPGKEGFFHSLKEMDIPKEKLLWIGQLQDLPVAVYPMDESPTDHARGARDILQHGQPWEVKATIRGLEMLHWQRDHRFCGRCGNTAKPMEKEPAMECSGCGHRVYPVLSPAVMVRIEHEGKILLARNSNFSGSLSSLLAGFVEAGETLEEAAHREVYEEVGLRIKNLQYFHSQSWPMPHTLLVGFTAQYAGGEIKPDGIEIIEADWGDPSQMDHTPRRGSLAYEMIQDFILKGTRY